METIIKKRENWLDYAKCIGMYFIVLGHIVTLDTNFDFAVWIFSFPLPFFFILSGYVINDKETILTSVKKSAKSLLQPYAMFLIITLVLQLGIYYFVKPDYFEANPLPDILRKSFVGFILAEGKSTPISSFYNIPLWFLVSLFFCRVFVQFVFENKANLNRNLIIMVLAAIGMTYFLASNSINLHFGVDSAIMAIPLFIFGYYFKKFDKGREYKLWLKIVLFIAFLLLGIALSYFNQDGVKRVDINRMGYGSSLFLCYINAIVGSLSVIFFCKIFSNISFRPLLYVGQNTLVILAFHSLGILVVYNFLVERGLRKLIPSFHADYSLPESAVVTILIMAACLIPAYIFRKYFPFVIGKSK